MEFLGFFFIVLPPFVTVGIMVVVGPVFLVRAFTVLRPLWYSPTSRSKAPLTPAHIKELTRYTQVMLVPGLAGTLGLLLVLVGFVTTPLAVMSWIATTHLGSGRAVGSTLQYIPLIYATLAGVAYVLGCVLTMSLAWHPYLFWWLAILPWVAASWVAGRMVKHANQHLVARDRYAEGFGVGSFGPLP